MAFFTFWPGTLNVSRFGFSQYRIPLTTRMQGREIAGFHIALGIGRFRDYDWLPTTWLGRQIHHGCSIGNYASSLWKLLGFEHDIGFGNTTGTSRDRLRFSGKSASSVMKWCLVEGVLEPFFF